jgi:hypothetical protein
MITYDPNIEFQTVLYRTACITVIKTLAKFEFILIKPHELKSDKLESLGYNTPLEFP